MYVRIDKKKILPAVTDGSLFHMLVRLLHNNSSLFLM